MHLPNRVHYDQSVAILSRCGELIAPQCFPLTMDDGHGFARSYIGLIANSHMLLGGDEWRFSGRRLEAEIELFKRPE